MSKPSPLLADLDALLPAGGTPSWDAVLARVLAHFDCPVGTIHLMDPVSGMLKLAASRGLPPPVLDKVGTIPIGKGMAGIAAERREPVQVCNLQTDASGVVRPGAKLTKMEGSLAAPMLDGQRLCGVFGVAKPFEYEFTAAETALLLEVGARIARQLPRTAPAR
jgi:signal transduction protein with GAF and PtsI domain